MPEGVGSESTSGPPGTNFAHWMEWGLTRASLRRWQTRAEEDNRRQHRWMVTYDRVRAVENWAGLGVLFMISVGPEEDG
jgi:hypothetical protein